MILKILEFSLWLAALPYRHFCFKPDIGAALV
jgi:hypothetical protein